MRKLMWFSIGFAAACVAGAYLLSGMWLLVLVLVCVAAVSTLFAVKGNKIAVVLLLGCAAGLFRFWIYDITYLNIARNNDGKTVYAEVEITDYSYETDYGVAADGRIELEGNTYKIRVYLSGFNPLSPGDLVQGDIRLRYTSDGGKSDTTYHQGKGIFLLGYVRENGAVIIAETVPNQYFPAMLRRNIISHLDVLFPEDTLAFARALLLGDSTKLTYETDTAFKVSGIRHVIAVSGLHVAILFSLVFTLAGKRRVMTAVLGIPALILFAAVAGFTPSVVRACIMQGLMILALLVNREYDSPTALGFAVLAILTANPTTVTSVSFQLSVGCMVGIFLFSGKIHNYLLQDKRFGKAKGNSLKERILRWGATSVSVSLSAMVVTTPLSACYFGMVSIVGTLTNILTLWIISFIFYGIIGACVAGLIWLPLGKVIAVCISTPIRYVVGVAKFLSSFDFSAVYTCSIYVVIWLVFSYALLTLFLLCRKKQPRVFACCIIFGLIISGWASWLEPRLDDYRVTVLDVGQGQSILIQHQGKNYLIDCGGDNANSAADTAAQTLLSQGITYLDGLIVTHYDKDHAGGVIPLLTRMPADVLYLPAATDGGEIYDLLWHSYKDRIYQVTENTVLDRDAMKISMFPASGEQSGNESSMCILFQIENCDILITGDRNSTGERLLMEQTELPQLELLVVGHHGSNTSSSFGFLEKTRPKTAVISVAADNSYGHPSAEVLERLKFFQCRVHRTDLEGTIIFRG